MGVRIGSGTLAGRSQFTRTVSPDTSSTVGEAYIHSEPTGFCRRQCRRFSTMATIRTGTSSLRSSSRIRLEHEPIPAPASLLTYTAAYIRSEAHPDQRITTEFHIGSGTLHELWS